MYEKPQDMKALPRENFAQAHLPLDPLKDLNIWLASDCQ